MKPDFVIIGAQKSGSTALMRHLAAHPQVYLPVQETRFFRDPWFRFEDPSVLEAAVATSRPGVLRRGIKCPDYLGEPACASRIHAALGDVQLLAVLREPVDRAISAYFWGMQWGWVPLAPPEIGLNRLLDGQLDDAYPRAREVLEYGLYGRHLTRYLKIFPKSNITVMLDEDLRRDPGMTLRQVFRFLDVEEDVEPAEPDRRVNGGVYSFTRLKFLTHRHRHILREFPGYPGTYLQPAKGAWPRIANRAISVADRLVLARLCDNSKPSVPDAVRVRLADYYRADLAGLEKLLIRDLSSWCKHESGQPASNQ